jgi:hypothetical protein
LYCTNPDPEHQYMFKNQALIGTLTNNMRNLSMTGSKLFGTYEVDNHAAGTYSSIPYLIEGTITTGFSGANTPEYAISFSGSTDETTDETTGGSEAAGSEAAGSEAAGSEAAGSEAAGSEAAGSEAAGSEAAGSEAAGSEAAGSEAAGSEAAGSEAAGSEAAGSEAAGSGGPTDETT